MVLFCLPSTTKLLKLHNTHQHSLSDPNVLKMHSPAHAQITIYKNEIAIISLLNANASFCLQVSLLPLNLYNDY